MQARERFRRFRGLKPGKRQARRPGPNKRGLWQARERFEGFEAWQTAGSKALTREGYVQAKGRLQCWNADGQELGGSCREGCAGKGQAATLEQQRLTARLGGSCREGIGWF